MGFKIQEEKLTELVRELNKSIIIFGDFNSISNREIQKLYRREQQKQPTETNRHVQNTTQKQKNTQFFHMYMEYLLRQTILW